MATQGPINTDSENTEDAAAVTTDEETNAVKSAAVSNDAPIIQSQSMGNSGSGVPKDMEIDDTADDVAEVSFEQTNGPDNPEEKKDEDEQTVAAPVIDSAVKENNSPSTADTSNPSEGATDTSESKSEEKVDEELTDLVSKMSISNPNPESSDDTVVIGHRHEDQEMEEEEELSSLEARIRKLQEKVQPNDKQPEDIESFMKDRLVNQKNNVAETLDRIKALSVQNNKKLYTTSEDFLKEINGLLQNIIDRNNQGGFSDDFKAVQPSSWGFKKTLTNKELMDQQIEHAEKQFLSHLNLQKSRVLDLVMQEAYWVSSQIKDFKLTGEVTAEELQKVADKTFTRTKDEHPFAKMEAEKDWIAVYNLEGSSDKEQIDNMKKMVNFVKDNTSLDCFTLSGFELKYKPGVSVSTLNSTDKTFKIQITDAEIQEKVESEIKKAKVQREAATIAEKTNTGVIEEYKKIGRSSFNATMYTLKDSHLLYPEGTEGFIFFNSKKIGKEITKEGELYLQVAVKDAHEAFMSVNDQSLFGNLDPIADANLMAQHGLRVKDNAMSDHDSKQNSKNYKDSNEEYYLENQVKKTNSFAVYSKNGAHKKLDTTLPSSRHHEINPALAHKLETMNQILSAHNNNLKSGKPGVDEIKAERMIENRVAAKIKPVGYPVYGRGGSSKQNHKTSFDRSLQYTFNAHLKHKLQTQKNINSECSYQMSSGEGLSNLAQEIIDDSVNSLMESKKRLKS